MKTTIFALLIMFATSAFAVQVDSPAPDFTLTGHDGKTYKLSDFKGKHVVLEWYNDDCPYVDKHYSTKNMQKLQKKFGAKDVAWFSVVSSAPGKQGHVDAMGAKRLVASREAAPRAVLLDPEGAVGQMYDAKTTPHMYVIDPKGTLVYMGAIDDKPSARHSSVEGAKNYVVAALDASMAGKSIATKSTKPYGCSIKY